MDYFHIYVRGLRRYIMNEREDTVQDALKIYARRKLIHHFMKYSLIMLFAYGIYSMFMMLVN